MRFEPLGDTAFILRDLQGPAHAIADELKDLNVPGLVEATASYDTVGIYIEPDTFDMALFESVLNQIRPALQWKNRRILIPVCFEMGEDLTEAANTLGLGEQELVQLFCATELTCYAVGFSPGFPYLGYLDERLHGLERLATPRVRVPKGSVAITGSQAGIYTLERPGGWWIIGRTPLELVDTETDYFPIKAGDTVAFATLSPDEFRQRQGERI